MPKTIRNQYDKYLTYENLMKAHIKSRKNKSFRKIAPNYIPQFITTSYACIKNRGMHQACIKDILLKILKRKIKDKKVLWLTKEIIYSNYKENGIKGLPIRKLYITNIC